MEVTMLKRSLVLIVGLIAGCGGNGDSKDPDGGGGGGPDSSVSAPDGGGGGGGPDGGDSPGSFDEEVGPFIDTMCMVESVCFNGDMQACVNDMTTDMADAQAQLDETGEMQCATCMHVKQREAQKILDATCDVNAGDSEAVFAACDLNPNVDFDGNGTPDDDHDEACAGFP
jgi:hypothetical protein